MIVHNLLIKLKDASPENMEAVREILLSMRGQIEGLRDLNVSKDIRRAETSYDLALVARFDTLEDFQTYLPHPAHRAAGEQIKDMLAATASVCYED